MKKIRNGLMLILIMIVSTAIFCGNSAEAAKKPAMVKKIVMKVGEEKLVTIKNTNKKVAWKCSNKNLLKVTKKGKYKATIQAKKKGRAILRATTGGTTLSCQVIIKDKSLLDWDTNISVKVGTDKATSRTYAKISWKYNSAADGYCIYRMTKPGKEDISKIEMIKKVKGNKKTSYKDLGYEDVKSLETPAYYVKAYKKLKNGKIIYCETKKMAAAEK